jgi:GNAT superfamily N-acetyltransferase
MNSIKNMVIALLFFAHAASIKAAIDNRPYSVKVLTGDKLKEMMPFVTTQRVLAFSSYPYLFVGNFAQEMKDFKLFTESKDSAIAVAYHGEMPVGLLTGCALPEYWPNKASDFKKVSVDPESCYYIPEIIVLPEYRGKKLSPKLVNALESYAKNLGYKKISLITESHKKHLLKPDDYKPLDSFWNHMQYRKTPLKLCSEWRTYQPDGSVKQQKHTCNFWTKLLDR